MVRLPKNPTKRRIGVDRGVNVICATDDNQRLNPNSQEKKSLLKNEKRKKRYQRRMARQQKNSKRKKKHQKKLSKIHEKKKNVRNNICHRISKKLVTNEGKDVIIFENLKTKNMIKSASGNLKKPGKNVKQKSGLNREILDKSWINLGIRLRFLLFTRPRNPIKSFLKLILNTLPKNALAATAFIQKIERGINLNAFVVMKITRITMQGRL